MDSRERLIHAMSDLMWERGYAATSPREVRERSGVGQGSMYHHFAGKHELALAALERNCADLLPATEDLLAEAGDPLVKLDAYLSREHQPLKGCKVGRMTQDPQVAADPTLLAPVRDAFATIHDRLVAVIDEAIALGELGADLVADELASMITATIQGGYVLAIAAQDSRPFDEARAGARHLLRAVALGAAQDRKEQK
jgi:Transcriptional regulator